MRWNTGSNSSPEPNQAVDTQEELDGQASSPTDSKRIHLRLRHGRRNVIKQAVRQPPIIPGACLASRLTEWALSSGDESNLTSGTLATISATNATMFTKSSAAHAARGAGSAFVSVGGSLPGETPCCRKTVIATATTPSEEVLILHDWLLHDRLAPLGK